MNQYYTKSSAVTAMQFTEANKGEFLMAFNRGRTAPPFLIDTGDVIRLERPGAAAIAIRLGDWLISHGADDFEVCDDHNFCSKFCPAS